MEKSENIQEVAVPENGEKAQEVAVPAQSREENAKYAAARRRAEAQRDAEVKRVREDAARQLQRQRTETADIQVRQKIDEQVREISALDPRIKSFSDLVKTENYDRFYALVKQGNNLVDAYKLANFEMLSRQTSESARQSARNSSAGKAHLKRTTSRGAGEVSVPQEIAAEYRQLMPNISNSEMQRHYNRYLNRGI